MAQTRKDLRGRVLRKGESQRRSDERYVYTYTDPLGRRKYVYAQDLVTLREKEAQLMKDQMDGLDIYVAGKATVNFVFDRYMSLKNNLKPTTKSNYLYMYDRFIQMCIRDSPWPSPTNDQKEKIRKTAQAILNEIGRAHV